ncbi:MAG: ATP-dependent protease subunit HslV [Candidatus Xenolissoclinum pacificiensis L6]|uniref:ATP-dependent protease subunit HslV n=1 Tax=Candidatus Xenolissoclinum pacificiensis L6 TaxID=1401685 RepID=W2UZG7_9RICK|nr:MAG: ATP-dependent protease subunit HslV [Candidatus Xenolissoclinum pacificiensis L6]
MSFHGTTILTVCRNGEVVVIGDGQVSVGERVVLKHTAQKVKCLCDGIIVGFAGVVGDSFALFERLEYKIKATPDLLKAAVSLAKEWRMDKALRRLDSQLIVVDHKYTLILTGSGEVLNIEDRVAAIGSGGYFALSAARALASVENNTMTTEELCVRSMNIAADICVFTNGNFTIKKIKIDNEGEGELQ